jgi:dTDP-4-dehydrorhamnose reductase
LKKVLITGSNGLLGQKLVKLFLAEEGAEVHALSKGPNRLINKRGYAYYDIDLLDSEALLACLKTISPDIIIHTAAMTNVDACELHQEQCDKMNVGVVADIVAYCKKHPVHLIHLSTDFIFDGNKGSVYKEEDLPDPVNYYGLSKWKSEKLIAESGIHCAILRTILVYGLVEGNDRSNIVLWVKNSLEQKKHINVVTDQLRMPTLSDDLAEACLLAVRHEANGVFHVSSSVLMSIYEIALAVADAFDLDKKYIHPVSSDALILPAKRPLSTGFDLNKSIEQINLPSYSFTERLQNFKDQLTKLEGAGQG